VGEHILSLPKLFKILYSGSRLYCRMHSFPGRPIFCLPISSFYMCKDLQCICSASPPLPSYFPSGRFRLGLFPSAISHSFGGSPFSSHPGSRLTVPIRVYFLLLAKNSTQWPSALCTSSRARRRSCSFRLFSSPVGYSASISGSSTGRNMVSTPRCGDGG
jgi:hypothetical protein